MAQWLECRTDDREEVLGSNPADGTLLRNFGNSTFHRCPSEDTLKTIGPIFLVSMPREVKELSTAFTIAVMGHSSVA